MDNNLVALLSALGLGGILTFLLRWALNREGRSSSTEYWYQEFKRISKRVDTLTDRVSNLETELAQAQEQVLFWRGSFYDEAMSHRETKHTLGEKLLELKRSGNLCPDDLDELVSSLRDGEGDNEEADPQRPET